MKINLIILICLFVIHSANSQVLETILTRLILQNSDSRNTTVSVTDLTGKTINIQLVKMSENSYGFDVDGLEKGVYFVTVNSNFQQKTTINRQLKIRI